MTDPANERTGRRGSFWDNVLHAVYPNMYWMGDAADHLKDKPLNRLPLPGAHDAGSYAIKTHAKPIPGSDMESVIEVFNEFTSRIPGFMEDWPIFRDIIGIPVMVARSQSSNFATMLARGVRYFDMRAVARGDEIWLAHTLYSTEITEPLAQIRDFLTQPEAKHELVILDFTFRKGQDLSPQQHNDLTVLLRQYLGWMVAPWRDVGTSSGLTGRSPQTRFHDLWPTGDRVVIIYGDDDTAAKNTNLLWPDCCRRSCWTQSATVEELMSALLTELGSGPPEEQFWVLQAQTTPNFEKLKKDIRDNLGRYVTHPGELLELVEDFASLEHAAEDVNVAVRKLLNGVYRGRFKGASPPAIVQTDFVEIGNWMKPLLG